MEWSWRLALPKTNSSQWGPRNLMVHWKMRLEMNASFSSWWLNQPLWNILYSQLGLFPQIGVKIKNYLSCPHLPVVLEYTPRNCLNILNLFQVMGGGWVWWWLFPPFKWRDVFLVPSPFIFQGVTKPMFRGPFKPLVSGRGVFIPTTFRTLV